MRDEDRRATEDRVTEDRAAVDLRCSVLVLREDSVLLCRRSDRPHRWALPGGTPRAGEGTAAAARREVAEETGVGVTVERIAFVLEASSWDRVDHRIEIVFLGALDDRQAVPVQLEEHLVPAFVPLNGLDAIGLRPPIAGYIRGFTRSSSPPTAAYLGNLWRAEDHDSPCEPFPHRGWP